MAVRICLTAVCALSAAPAFAQTCDSVWSQTSLASMSGRMVRSVRVETHEPESLPFLPAMLDKLHVRTRENTVRRLLLVDAGAPLDTLQVAESLRRLRQLRYLNETAILATSCGGPIDLVVVSRDAWSMRPSLQVRSTSQALTFTDRNIFGTGREATVGFRTDDTQGLALTAGIRDPWLFGRDVSLSLTSTGWRERGAQSVTIQRRERSVLDLFGVEARVERTASPASTLDVPDVNGIPVSSLQHLTAHALASARVNVSNAAVTHIVTGIEYDQIAWETASDRRLSLREFAGIDAGLRRRSLAYDTVTWYLPQGGLADVPLAFQYDVLVGLGGDLSRAAPAIHVDAWAGKMWLAGRRALWLADAWGSGFRSAGAWSGATVRGALTYEHAALRGRWSVRLGGEKSTGADPDVRALTTSDLTLRSLGDTARRATTALLGSIERRVHLRRLTRSYTLDAAAFTAASARSGASVGVVGLGLHLAPARLGRVTARLDVGYPIARSGDVRPRPYLALGISPWLEQDRQRDGRRTR